MTREELNAFIEARITDNNSNLITPEKHRQVEFALADYIETLINDAQAPAVVEIGLGQLQDVIAESELVPGAIYKVIFPENDTSLTSPGGLRYVLTRATSVNEIDHSCVGSFMVQDWETIGTNVFGLPQYLGIEVLTGYEPNINRGPWDQEDENTYNNGDFVFRDGITYQVHNNSQLNGSPPGNNPAAYEQLYKKQTEGLGYLPELNYIIWDGSSEYVLERRDQRGNIALCFEGQASFKMDSFKWGSNLAYNNFMDRNSVVVNCNDNTSFAGNFILGETLLYLNKTFSVNNCFICSKGETTISGVGSSLSNCEIHAFSENFVFSGEHFGKISNANGSNFFTEIDLSGNDNVSMDGLGWVGVVVVMDSVNSPGVLRRIGTAPNHEIEIRAKDYHTIQISRHEDSFEHLMGDSFIFSKRLPVTLSNGNHFVRLKKNPEYYPDGPNGDGPYITYELTGCHDIGIIQPEVTDANINLHGPHFSGKYYSGRPLYEFVQVMDVGTGDFATILTAFACDPGDGSFYALLDLSVAMTGGTTNGAAQNGPSSVTHLVNRYEPATGNIYFSHGVNGTLVFKVQFLKNV